MSDDLTPAASAYPWLAYQVQLTGVDGGLVCNQNPLNGLDSGVTTKYTDTLERKFFCYDYDGAEVDVGVGLGCLPRTGYFAVGNPKLHADLELVEPGYCAPSAAEWAAIGRIERWATAFGEFYRQPEGGGDVALDVALDSPILRGYFDFSLRVHYEGVARQPELDARALALLPVIYPQGTVITEACEEVGRMAGFVQLFEGISRQPEARSKLLGIATYAGNLAALADPKVVVARASAIAAVIAGVARQPEAVGMLRAAAFDLLGAYAVPDGTGNKAAAILALVTTTEAVLDGIARQPEAGNGLIYLTKLLMEEQSTYDPAVEYDPAYEPAYEPVLLTDTIGALATERLLAAFDRAVASQPEARPVLAAALLQLSGIEVPTVSE